MFYLVFLMVILATLACFASLTIIGPKDRKLWLGIALALGVIAWIGSLFLMPFGAVFWSVSAFTLVLFAAGFGGELINIYMNSVGNKSPRTERGVYWSSLNSISFSLLVALMLLIGLQFFGLTKMSDGRGTLGDRIEQSQAH